MTYCKKCGIEIKEDAVYCPGCGATLNIDELVLATWGERFLAYFIDLILLGIVLSPITWGGFLWMPHMFRSVPHWVPFVDFGFKNIIYFLYWTFLEGSQGQSVGKKIMKIRVVDLNGGPIDMGKSAYQAVGKAFLTPLDLIVGWIMYPDKQQRLFNYLSETVVVKE